MTQTFDLCSHLKMDNYCQEVAQYDLARNQSPWFLKSNSHFSNLLYCIAGKFGGELNLAFGAVYVKTAKLKSAKFFYVCMYVWRYHTIPPNLSPLMVLNVVFSQTAKFNDCQYFRLYGSTST